MMTKFLLAFLLTASQAQAIVFSGPRPGTQAPQEVNPAQNRPAQPQSGLNCQGGPTDEYSQYECEVLRLVNQTRTARGLRELKPDPLCHKSAKTHAADVIKNFSRYTRANFKTHTDIYGQNPTARARRVGMSAQEYPAGAGENTARGQRTPEEVVRSWMNSEGHRANILSRDMTHIGIALKVGKDANGRVFMDNHIPRIYWVQCFTYKNTSDNNGFLGGNANGVNVNR
ncbi:MAG: hypothetical protein KDD33_13665 [Bdellovibrionales bacterium]|nr:hypothetical protein [Bdellovibrionales bacterium]